MQQPPSAFKEPLPPPLCLTTRKCHRRKVLFNGDIGGGGAYGAKLNNKTLLLGGIAPRTPEPIAQAIVYFWGGWA